MNLGSVLNKRGGVNSQRDQAGESGTYIIIMMHSGNNCCADLWRVMYMSVTSQILLVSETMIFCLATFLPKILLDRFKFT